MISGQRGKRLLLFDGFTFSKNNVVNDTIYWCCRTRVKGQPSCRARIKTTKQHNGLYEVTVTRAVHNHTQTIRMLKKFERNYSENFMDENVTVKIKNTKKDTTVQEF